MAKIKIVYRIRDKRTGLFSKGGAQCDSYGTSLYYQHWSRTGKVWRGIGPLRNHLNFYAGSIPESWEVITYEVKEETIGLRPASEYISKAGKVRI